MCAVAEDTERDLDHNDAGLHLDKQVPTAAAGLCLSWAAPPPCLRLPSSDPPPPKKKLILSLLSSSQPQTNCTKQVLQHGFSPSTSSLARLQPPPSSLLSLQHLSVAFPLLFPLPRSWLRPLPFRPLPQFQTPCFCYCPDSCPGQALPAAAATHCAGFLKQEDGVTCADKHACIDDDVQVPPADAAVLTRPGPLSNRIALVAPTGWY